MNCWHCKTELIWGGDDDCDEEMEFVWQRNIPWSPT
jgi:hypothetical protein